MAYPYVSSKKFLNYEQTLWSAWRISTAPSKDVDVMMQAALESSGDDSLKHLVWVFWNIVQEGWCVETKRLKLIVVLETWSANLHLLHRLTWQTQTGRQGCIIIIIISIIIFHITIINIIIVIVVTVTLSSSSPSSQQEGQSDNDHKQQSGLVGQKTGGTD